MIGRLISRALYSGVYLGGVQEFMDSYGEEDSREVYGDFITRGILASGEDASTFRECGLFDGHLVESDHGISTI